MILKILNNEWTMNASHNFEVANPAIADSREILEENNHCALDIWL